MKTIHIAKFKKDLNKIIDEIIKTNEPILIASPKGELICFPKKKWESLLLEMKSL